MANWKAKCLKRNCKFEATSAKEAAKHSEETGHTLQMVDDNG